MKKEYFSVTLSLIDIQSVSLKLAGVLDCRFYELSNTGREVYSMNLAWRFIKGDVPGMPPYCEF